MAAPSYRGTPPHAPLLLLVGRDLTYLARVRSRQLQEQATRMAGAFEVDIFIAYASADAPYAKSLHAVLSTAGHRVFLSSESIPAGVRWPERVTQAQQSALLTVILISDRSSSAYFQQGEVLAAIKRAAEETTHKMVPVYLSRKRPAGLPSFLEQWQEIVWDEGTSLLSVAQEIETALADSKQYEVHEIVSSTIVLVTGCHFLPELFDRPAAYELKTAIDEIGKSTKRVFLRSIVMGDIWFLQHSDIPGHPNVVSLGSGGYNILTKEIAEHARPVQTGSNGRWQIVRHDNRWALWGDRAEDTHDAVACFKHHHLPAFLGSLWS